MLRFVLRRLLVVLPTLAGVTVVGFVLLVLATPHGPGAAAEERGRALFLDLPLVVNPHPRDLEVEVLAAIDDASLGRPAPDLSARGSALVPVIVPRLGALSPPARTWALAALAGVAPRFVDPGALADGDDAVLAWEEAWEAHRLDFRPGHVRRLLRRATRGTSRHATDELRVLGTYALDETVLALDDDTLTRDGREQLVALLRDLAPDAAAARFGPGDPRAPGAWAEWWFVHRTDYVVFTRVEDAIGVVLDTRYGRWVERLVSLRLGTSVRDGRPVLTKLRARGAVTLSLAALAALLAFLGAVPLGLFMAVRKGSLAERTISWVSFVLYSLPVVWVATVMLGVLARGHASIFLVGGLSTPALAHEGWPVRALDVVRHLALPVICLAYPSLVTLSRHQRSAALDVVRSDYVRAARAKGLPESVVLRRHVLRIAFLPVLTLSGLQVPLLLGTSVVVEELFGIPGVGAETVDAVATGDVPWLLAVLVLAALASTLAVLLSDVLYALVDPRTRRPRGGLA